MYKIYILKSNLQHKFYVGYTDNLEKRLVYHNAGKVRSTKAYKPWSIIHTEDFYGKTDALKRERQIKSYKGGEAFKNLVKNSSVSERRDG